MGRKARWMMLANVIGIAFAGSTPTAIAATAVVSDPAGDTAFSFDQTTDLTQLTVVWDGSLTISATYAQTPPSTRLSVLVSSAAQDEDDPSIESCDAEMADSLTVTAFGSEAQLEVPNVEGILTADAQRTPTSMTYAFSSPTLTQIFAPGNRDPFVCVDGNADGDTFYGGFADKSLKLTTAVAQAGARIELTRRFGARFTGSPRSSIRCLDRAIDAATDGTADEPGTAARARCAFEFRQGKTTRSGEVAIFLANGVPQEADFFSRVLPSGLQQCGTTDFSTGPGGRRWLNPPFPAGFGGAFMTVWSRRVPCSAARSAALRWHGNRRFRGYRCTVLKRGQEFIAVNCKRPGGRIVRFETGA